MRRNSRVYRSAVTASTIIAALAVFTALGGSSELIRRIHRDGQDGGQVSLPPHPGHRSEFAGKPRVAKGAALRQRPRLSQQALTDSPAIHFSTGNPPAAPAPVPVSAHQWYV